MKTLGRRSALPGRVRTWATQVATPVTGDLVFVQPTVPRYRECFFERLRRIHGASLRVHASSLDMDVLSQRDDLAEWMRPLGRIVPVFGGLQWQRGALDVPFGRHDLLVVCGAPRCLTNLLLLEKAKRRGTKTLWWGHYWSSSSRRWRAAIRLRWLRRADGVLFYTDDEVDAFRRCFPELARLPVFALNNGLDNVRIRSLRRPYRASGRDRRCLFIGRLTPKADLPLLLDALARDECRGIVLDVIGGGEAMSSLRRHAEDRGLSGRVVWHGGLIDEERIAEIANRCRLFVYPGEVGLSLVHALSYGLPVVLHGDRWRHMPEIAAFSEGGNGVAFEPGDAGSLALAISSLIDDGRCLESMARNAIDLTDRTFNADDMVERFMKALEGLGWPA